VPLRFYRRVRVLPGVSVNVSRSGPSLSFGIRGAHVTVGRTGITRIGGIPGTGVFYTSRTGRRTGAHYEGGVLGWALALAVGALIVISLLHSQH
jgi:hypothetical protein